MRADSDKWALKSPVCSSASFWKRPFMLTDQQPDHILVHTWLRGKTVDNKTVFKLRASDIGFLHAAVEREKGGRD